MTCYGSIFQQEPEGPVLMIMALTAILLRRQFVLKPIKNLTLANLAVQHMAEVCLGDMFRDVLDQEPSSVLVLVVLQ